MVLPLDSLPLDPVRHPVAALHVEGANYQIEIPSHAHDHGQLILALRGAVTCHVPAAMWMVPPGQAVWIPAGLEHRSPATPNARMCFLFVDTHAARLPAQCCTLQITPMIREMILHLADNSNADQLPDDDTLLLMQVLLSQLERMPTGGLELPVSSHPKLRQFLDGLSADPADRRTIGEWAGQLAMSERTLARLVVKETGMTFGRWRQQLHLLIALSQLAGGASVQRVSEALGYESPTSFIIMFKGALGTTPARYFDDKAPRSPSE
ncbi:AraC family transcriptional regulator [Methylobacterium sp. R2-1]|uniref:AraC family transcriptional regulator n=1 Tax=Methylobacterium sp. R2-1 TaxID=2587064 RepID=UPI0016089D77|nr:helix-turn-helix transcriptional regulator [Methylobacterium sp. R2-1]MBB2963368.1 AraC-like DNA-binding protein [Methylobacterium sp. R2-1]